MNRYRVTFPISQDVSVSIVLECSAHPIARAAETIRRHYPRFVPDVEAALGRATAEAL